MSDQQSCVYPLQLFPGDKITVENRIYTVHSVDPYLHDERPLRGMLATVGIETRVGTYLTLPANAQVEVTRAL